MLARIVVGLFTLCQGEIAALTGLIDTALLTLTAVVAFRRPPSIPPCAAQMLSMHLVVGFAVALVYLVILWQHGTQGEMGATSLIYLER